MASTPSPPLPASKAALDAYAESLAAELVHGIPASTRLPAQYTLTVSRLPKQPRVLEQAPKALFSITIRTTVPAAVAEQRADALVAFVARRRRLTPLWVGLVMAYGCREPVDPGGRSSADQAGDVAATSARSTPPFKVLHNDDYTTQEFVVFILKTIFHHQTELAFQIMMHVHKRGIGVAGLFPYETAEAKVSQVHALARENEFPLRARIEPE